MKANNTQIVNRGIGGCCDKYNVDSIEVNGVVIAVRFTRWDNESRKYYEIPVSVKNQAAVIAAFPELDITEDEPGAILLRNADDETTVKVGMFAAELDGELTPEPTNTDNNNNPENNTPSTMNANETKANDIRESISRLRYELQQYNDNASKGGSERRRNMTLLRWDIRKMERQLKAMGAQPRTKTINSIMNQANRLMSVCNAARNFKRADAINAIAFRYYDNIRACVGRFNYNDDSEYNKEYSRAQYMNA